MINHNIKAQYLETELIFNVFGLATLDQMVNMRLDHADTLDYYVMYSLL